MNLRYSHISQEVNPLQKFKNMDQKNNHLTKTDDSHKIQIETVDSSFKEENIVKNSSSRVGSSRLDISSNTSIHNNDKKNSKRIQKKEEHTKAKYKKRKSKSRESESDNENSRSGSASSDASKSTMSRSSSHSWSSVSESLLSNSGKSSGDSHGNDSDYDSDNNQKK